MEFDIEFFSFRLGELSVSARFSFFFFIFSKKKRTTKNNSINNGTRLRIGLRFELREKLYANRWLIMNDNDNLWFLSSILNSSNSLITFLVGRGLFWTNENWCLDSKWLGGSVDFPPFFNFSSFCHYSSIYSSCFFLLIESRGNDELQFLDFSAFPLIFLLFIDFLNFRYIFWKIRNFSEIVWKKIRNHRPCYDIRFEMYRVSGVHEN